jgi:hypothetical protein
LRGLVQGGERDRGEHGAGGDKGVEFHHGGLSQILGLIR